MADQTRIQVAITYDFKKAKADFNKTIKDIEAQSKGINLNASSSVNKYTDAVNKTTTASTKFANSSKIVDERVERIAKATNEASTNVQSMTSSMLHNVSAMLQWGIAASLLYGNLRKIREGVDFLKETDSQMSTIRAITGLTRQETDDLVKSYIDLGDALSISADKLNDASVQLFRQGLSIAEVNNRIEDFVKLSKVLGIELDGVTEKSTAAINSMGVTAERVGDVVTALGSNAATSGSEVLTALQRVASTASVTNVSLEQASSLIALISSKTRLSSETIGASLNTILTKLAQTDALTGEVNKDFGKIVNRMDELGIAVRDSSKNLLTPFELLTNTAEAWDTLTSKQQAYIAGGIGVRQFNRYISAVSDSEELTRLLGVAQESAGTVTQQYTEYLTTNEAATERLNNEYLRLANDTINSKLINSLINLSSKIVGGVNDLNLLEIAFSGVVGVVSILAGRQLILLITQFSEFIIIVKNLGVQMAIATALGSAASAMFLGLVGVIGALTFGLIAYSKAEEKRNEQARVTIQNAGKEIEKINELEESYNTLSKSSMKDIESKEDLLEIQKKLNSEYPELIGNLRAEGTNT